MSIGAISKTNFEEFLKKIGKADDVKPNATTNPIRPQNGSMSAVDWSKTSIFSVLEKSGNTQTTEKENSGSNAASMNGGNIMARFLNIGNTNPVENTPDVANNVGNLDAAASGHTPQGTAPVTPTAIRETSGNEATNPEQNKLQKETQNKISQYYEQFKAETAQNQAKEDEGIKAPTDGATLSAGDNKVGDVKSDKIEGADKPANSPEGQTTQKPEAKSETKNQNDVKTPDKNDKSNADNATNINKQQETKQQETIQEQEKLKKAEEARKRTEDD